MNEVMINTQHHCLKLQANGIIRFVTLSEIVYLKADDNYTCFVLNDLSQYIMCKTLQNFETTLGYLFFRAHKSYLINTIYIRGINKRDYQKILSSGEKLP